MAFDLQWPAAFADARDTVRDRLARGAVHVLEGAQAGSSVELGTAALRIGADPHNDVVLLADGLDPAHARISFADALGRRLRVEAVGASVTLDRGTVLEPGYDIEVPLPATMALGSAVVRVEGERLLPAITLPRGLAVAALVAGIAVLAGVPWSNGRALPLAAPRQTTAMVSETRAKPVVAAAKIKRIVADSNLGDQVSVIETGANEVTLSGRIDRTALPAWRGAVMKIDADADPVTVLNTVQVAEEAIKPPQIRSVWFGSNPRVMMADGRFLAAGETTPDGWTVADIASDAVTMKSQAHAPVRIAF